MPGWRALLGDNLFQPLLPVVRDAFVRGRGDGIGLRGYPGKMQAVYSSPALGVKVFQHGLYMIDPIP